MVPQGNSEAINRTPHPIRSAVAFLFLYLFAAHPRNISRSLNFSKEEKRPEGDKTGRRCRRGGGHGGSSWRDTGCTSGMADSEQLGLSGSWRRTKLGFDLIVQRDSRERRVIAKIKSNG